MASFGKFLQNLAYGIVAFVVVGLLVAFVAPWITEQGIMNWSRAVPTPVVEVVEVDETTTLPPADTAPPPVQVRHRASADERTSETGEVSRIERGGHRESGGSRVTVSGSEQSRISEAQVASAPRCDPNEQYCWRFPSRYARDTETAHRIIRFIQSEIRNPRGREVPPELNRWQFTDSVPPNGSTPLVDGGEVVWAENANFNHN